MNLIEILKDKIGCKLYSTICGECTLTEIDLEDTCPIKVITGYNTNIYSFDEEGRYYKNIGECLLFPSKENRDWSSIIPKHEFKPFEKVLVRHNDVDFWSANLFSNYLDSDFVCVSGVWNQCIPFEGNEHLLSTTNKPKLEE